MQSAMERKDGMLEYWNSGKRRRQNPEDRTQKESDD